AVGRPDQPVRVLAQQPFFVGQRIDGRRLAQCGGGPVLDPGRSADGEDGRARSAEIAVTPAEQENERPKGRLAPELTGRPSTAGARPDRDVGRFQDGVLRRRRPPPGVLPLPGAQPPPGASTCRSTRITGRMMMAAGSLTAARRRMSWAIRSSKGNLMTVPIAPPHTWDSQPPKSHASP